MEQIIETLNAFIEGTGIFDNWGGWCLNNPPKTGKIYPYGIKPIEIDISKTNLYTYSDSHSCTGYLFVSNIRGNNPNIRNEVIATITIHVFTNVKKDGNLVAGYNRPLSLFGMLSKKYRNIRFLTPIVNQFQEFAAIEIDLPLYAPCEYNA